MSGATAQLVVVAVGVRAGRLVRTDVEAAAIQEVARGRRHRARVLGVYDERRPEVNFLAADAQVVLGPPVYQMRTEKLLEPGIELFPLKSKR